VWRRGEDDVLLLTEPELGDVVQAQLTRMRFAAKCEIAPEEHSSAIVFDAVDGIPNRDYGRPAVEVLDSDLDGEADLERLRIEAATPRYGAEIDDRVLPAEAGLDERAVSFSKGCYPGQEPIARQHYRGKVNRRLRVLEVAGTPVAETPVVFGGKEVGRITSSVDGLALGYVRVEVPDDATLDVGGEAARLHLPVERP
jgi:folate-binding protein YgfZ